jgi:hypothetical protein
MTFIQNRLTGSKAEAEGHADTMEGALKRLRSFLKKAKADQSAKHTNSHIHETQPIRPIYRNCHGL